MQVSPDTEGFAEELQEKLDEATSGVKANAKVGLDTEELDDQLDEAKAKLEEFDGETASAKLGLEKAEFDDGMDEAEARHDEFDGKKATASLGLDKDAFDADLDDADERLDEMDGKTARPRLDLDDDQFQEKLSRDKQELAAANSESGEGSLMGAIGMGVGSLLPGIGGAAAGLGLLGGVGALAFGGIASALSAAHQSTQNMGLTSAQVASTQYSNAVAVQQAQQSVGQAHRQAAEDAVNSAQAIEQADMSLTETERNAAASQIQAIESVGQAKQGVEQANYGLTEAEYSLSQAWVQARENLQSLNDQLADQKLSVKAAALAVQQAEYQQTLTDQNAYSTSLDRQQAALAVAQAQQQLKDATDQEADAQTAATLADKQGVAGSQTVVQAKQAVVQAQYAQQNAAQAYADAQRNLTDTELNNAEQVKAAQMQVAAAQRQAAYTQQQDAIAVASAQQNLTDTIREQQLQAAATASTENQAANQFARDMAKLTPVGRRFVDQVLSMRGAFHQLETAAQNAVLPGVTGWLNGIKGILPTVSKGVTAMGTAMGNAFGQFGKQMATPGFAKVLNGLITNGIQFAQIVLPAFAGFLTALMQIGSQPGAVTGLAGLLAGIGHGLTGLADSVGRYEQPINAFLQAVGDIIAQIGPPLGQIIGLVARALGPLTTYLDKHPNGTVVKVIGDIVGGLLAFKGLQKLLPDFISGPLSKFASKGGEMLMKPFKDAAGKIPGLLNKAWTGVNQGFLRVFGEGGLVEQGWAKLFGEGGLIPSAWAKVFGEGGLVQTGWANVTSWGSSFATNVGSWMSQAAGAVVNFATTLGTRLAEAATATWTWVAENTAAGATYIAENVAMAASATAAFIAENAATLGLIAVIGGIVTAIVYVATHWQQSWTDIKNWAEDAWHFIYDGIGKYLLPLLGPAGLIALGVIELAQHWSTVWGTIKRVAADVWGWLKQGAADFVSGFATAWDKLESVFKTPVNFLIKTVYMGGIRPFWDDIVNAVGLNHLDLPPVSALAGGGMIPGYSPGHDTRIAAVSPGEGILTPQATQAIGGKPAVDSLNRAYPPSSSRPGSGELFGAGKFASGGVVGALGSVLSGGVGVGKAVMALMTGNTTAFVNALSPMIGTSASGTLGKVMVALPKTLMTDAAKAVISLLTGGTKATGSNAGAVVASTLYGAGTGALTAQVQSWFAAAQKAARFPLSWIPSLETIARYESGYNPNAVNNTAAGIAAGTPRGIMQEIASTFLAYHTSGTSMNIYDPVANIASAARYITARYRTPDDTPGLLAVAQGEPYSYYDQGGWLQPGMTLAYNNTGQPERVLNPQQSAALTQQTTPTVVNNNLYFTGPQMPSQEQLAEMYRQLALTLS